MGKKLSKNSRKKERFPLKNTIEAENNQNSSLELGCVQPNQEVKLGNRRYIEKIALGLLYALDKNKRYLIVISPHFDGLRRDLEEQNYKLLSASELSGFIKGSEDGVKLIGSESDIDFNGCSQIDAVYVFLAKGESPKDQLYATSRVLVFQEKKTVWHKELQSTARWIFSNAKIFTFTLIAIIAIIFSGIGYSIPRPLPKTSDVSTVQRNIKCDDSGDFKMLCYQTQDESNDERVVKSLCHYVTKDQLTAEEANKECLALNSTLWEVSNGDEWEMMTPEINKESNRRFHLNGKEVGLHCADGVDCQNVQQAIQGKGIPVQWMSSKKFSKFSKLNKRTKGKKTCLATSDKKGLWENIDCNTKIPAICVRKPES